MTLNTTSGPVPASGWYAQLFFAQILTRVGECTEANQKDWREGE